ncbi:MAG: YigZ family protein [Gemmatimonadota bacterium]
MSDDGEPHGTAGRPMLTVLLHSGVGEVVAVVTRYYGGTKLGTGGLVKAYGGMVKLAFESLPLREKVDVVEVRVTIDYASVTVAQQQFDAIRAEIMDEKYEANVQYRLLVPRTEITALISALADATRGAAVVEVTQ